MPKKDSESVEPEMEDILAELEHQRQQLENAPKSTYVPPDPNVAKMIRPWREKTPLRVREQEIEETPAYQLIQELVKTDEYKGKALALRLIQLHRATYENMVEPSLVPDIVQRIWVPIEAQVLGAPDFPKYQPRSGELFKSLQAMEKTQLYKLYGYTKVPAPTQGDLERQSRDQGSVNDTEYTAWMLALTPEFK